MNKEQINQYLSYLGIEVPENAAPDIELLKKIVFAHNTKIPFTNLTYLEENPYKLTPDAVFERVIIKKKGGVCLELHCLLGELLTQLGYKVANYRAVSYHSFEHMETFYHRVLSVTDCAGDRWYCDVAALSAPKHPVKFADGEVCEQFGEKFRLDLQPDGKWLMNKVNSKGEWKKEYMVDASPAPDGLFDELKASSMAEKRAMLNHGEVFFIKIPEGSRSYWGNEYCEVINGEAHNEHIDDCDIPKVYSRFNLNYDEVHVNK